MEITKEYFAGRWRDPKVKGELTMGPEGDGEAVWGSERYKASWRFSPPKHLLVRVVIPMNNPEYDDELNAHEMALTITQASEDRFTAEEYDEEGLREFTRI